MLTLSIPKLCPVESDWKNSPVPVSFDFPSGPFSFTVFSFISVYEFVQVLSKSLPLLLIKLKVPLAIDVNVFLSFPETKIVRGIKSASKLTYMTKFSGCTSLGKISPFDTTVLGSTNIKLFWSTFTNMLLPVFSLLFAIIQFI